MGRRWGKTVLGGAVSLSVASQGGRVAWVVPTFKNSRPLWRAAVAAVGPLKASGAAVVNKTDLVIEFPSPGGFLGIYSADNADAMRGEAFHVVIADEAARISDIAWTDVIQPTLADYDGDAILISTPKGRNWFWQEYVNARADGNERAAWQAPSSANPLPQIQKAARLAQERVPERTYQQEWLAEFVEDAGLVFRGVRARSTAKPADPVEGHRYVMGVDWAKSYDWTVLSVIDATMKTQVAMDRFNKIDYTFQIGRLNVLADRYNPDVIVAEENAMGAPLIDQARRQMKMPIRGFTTTSASKAMIIEGLALAIEKDDITLLDNETQINELQAYDMERLPGGSFRYGAPEGMHDDTVMALALSWSAASREKRVAYSFQG